MVRCGDAIGAGRGRRQEKICKAAAVMNSSETDDLALLLCLMYILYLHREPGTRDDG